MWVTVLIFPSFHHCYYTVPSVFKFCLNLTLNQQHLLKLAESHCLFSSPAPYLSHKTASSILRLMPLASEVLHQIIWHWWKCMFRFQACLWENSAKKAMRLFPRTWYLSNNVSKLSEVPLLSYPGEMICLKGKWSINKRIKCTLFMDGCIHTISSVHCTFLQSSSWSINMYQIIRITFGLVQVGNSWDIPREITPSLDQRALSAVPRALANPYIGNDCSAWWHGLLSSACPLNIPIITQGCYLSVTTLHWRSKISYPVLSPSNFKTRNGIFVLALLCMHALTVLASVGAGHRDLRPAFVWIVAQILNILAEKGQGIFLHYVSFRDITWW